MPFASSWEAADMDKLSRFDAILASRAPPPKRDTVSARFEYQKMTGREFSAALAEIDLAPKAFARIFGVRPEVVQRWIKGEQDVATWVFPVMWLLREIPEGIAIARSAAANHIKIDRDHPDRGEFPYLRIPDEEAS